MCGARVSKDRNKMELMARQSYVIEMQVYPEQCRREGEKGASRKRRERREETQKERRAEEREALRNQRCRLQTEGRSYTLGEGKPCRWVEGRVASHAPSR